MSTVMVTCSTTKMNWFQQHNKRLLRFGGVFFILIGVGIALLWHLWLVPRCRRYDPRWQEKFTEAGYWKMIQNHIHQYGWSHDDFGIVGMYGDESWVEWIMDKASDGASLYGCGSDGHKDEALKRMTNQDPTGGKEFGGEKEWLMWWATNQKKSQPEWIQAGFAEYKVTVSIPPSRNQDKALLAMLGNTSTNEVDKIPEFVKYNAFRWLRDSDFSPVGYALSNVTESTSRDVVQGLTEYQKRYEWSPKRDAIGILPLANNSEDNYEPLRPAFFGKNFQVVGYSFMIVPIAIGIVMLGWSRRRRKNVEPSNPPYPDTAAPDGASDQVR
jgi:hypothetical protein